MELASIQEKLKTIIAEVLKLEGGADAVGITTPFFSTSPDQPGLIEDSLAILEIASRVSEEFSLMPGEIEEKSFVNIETLSKAIGESIPA